MKHKNAIKNVLLSDDDKRLISWCNNVAFVWDVSNGRLLGASKYHESPIIAAFFTSQEASILIWTKNGTSNLVNIFNGQIHRTINHHEKSINGAAFLNGNRYLRSWTAVNEHGLVIKNGRMIQKSRMEMAQERQGYISESSGLVARSPSGRLRLWDAFAERYTGLMRPIPVGTEFEYHSNVDDVILGNHENQVLIIKGSIANIGEIQTGKKSSTLRHYKKIDGAKFSPDDLKIITWSSDETARIWDNTKTIKKPLVLKHHDIVTGATFNKDATMAITWSNDHTVCIWDTKNGKQLGKPLQHNNNLGGARLNNNEDLLLTWCEDGTARLWDVYTYNQIGLNFRHEDKVNGAIFNTNEQLIISWSKDGTIKVWNILSDLDFPKEYYILQTEAISGSRFDPNTQQISYLSPKEFKVVRNEWLKVAREHIKTCKYKHKNVYLNFFLERNFNINAP